MKRSVTLIILLFSTFLVATFSLKGGNDSLYFEHRMNIPNTPLSEKLVYVDSLLSLKKADRDSVLGIKAELAYTLCKYNSVIDAYEELIEKYPSSLSLSKDLKLQLYYIHSLYSKRQFYECIVQCADLLNKTKPDSLRYYDSLVECMLVDFNHQTSVPFSLEYIDRSSQLLKKAINNKWPQNTIDNLKYAFFTLKMKEAMHNDNYDTALVYLDSMSNIPLSKNRRESVATNIAYTYMRLGKFDVAERCFKDILESDLSNERKAVSLLNYSHMLNMQGRYDETLSCLDKYQMVGESLKKELYGAYLLGNRAIAEHKLGKHEEAFKTLMASKSLSDSIYSNSGIQDGLLMLFDQNAKSKSLGTIEKKLESADRWLITVGALAIVMIVICVWLFVKLRRKEKSTLRLKEEFDELKTRYQEIERSYKDIIQEGSSKVAAELLPLAHKEDAISQLETTLKDNSLNAKEKVKLMEETLASTNISIGSREMFEHHFEQAHSEFFRRLYAAYPSLSPVEVRMCAFLVMNLSNKEIAAIVNKSVRSVESTRYRISKKLEIPDGESIISHLRQFLA